MADFCGLWRILWPENIKKPQISAVFGGFYGMTEIFGCLLSKNLEFHRVSI
jgi:hypothetical protein